MLIEVPRDLFDRLQARARREGITEVEVIRLALDSLEWHEQEVAAIQEGIDAWRAGDTVDFATFDAEFRKKHGIPDDI
jgi:predicted transcriptional regulator